MEGYIDCAGKCSIARGVEAGLQDASDTSAIVSTSIVNRMPSAVIRVVYTASSITNVVKDET
jgi:microcompartment protein CcmL/EutN